MVRIFCAILLFVTGVAGATQLAPTFEVASVRRAAGDGPPGDVARNMDPAPGSSVMRNVPLRMALEWAYDLKRYQIFGPAWIENEERYDIIARAAGPAQQSEMRLMLQTLLTARMDRPVIDMTGIEGVYDYTVETGGLGFNGQPPADPAAGPSIFTAVQDNLGLRLESRRAPIEVLVVDTAQRTPTEN